MRKCIRITNHNPDCPDPSNCRASYSRKTVGKGEQRYKHDFNRCLSCGVFEQVDFTGGEYEYERIGDTNILKLTRKIRTKAFGNLDRKLSSEEVECVRRVTGLTIEEPTTTYSKRPSSKTRLFTKKIISNEESLIKKIKGLEGFYKKVILKLRCYVIGYKNPEDFGWNSKLVKRFLAIKPTKECLVRVFMGPNFLWEGFTASALRGKRRIESIGSIINKGDGWGYMTPVDDETWIKILMAETKTRNEVMKAVIKKKARQRRKKKMLPYLTVVN